MLAKKIRCAHVCIACDLPAACKACGFLSCVANLGCSRCYNFGTGVFGKQNFGRFSHETWNLAQTRNIALTFKRFNNAQTKQVELKWNQN